MNIIVVGSSNTDMIIKVPRIPKPGETVLGGTFTTAAGGKGANQAVAAARAGGNVTFIASVGNDVFGRQAIKNFQTDKINIDHIKMYEDSPSGVALIFVDEKGENSIAVASGANALLSPDDIHAAKSGFENAGVLVLQLETPIESVNEAVLLAQQNNILTILNPAPAQPLSDALLKYVTIITPNETEAELLTGIPVDSEQAAKKAADILLSKGVKTVLITMGVKGSFIATENYSKMVPAFKVEAVDTTAAGDVYNGALAVAVSEGKELYDAVVFANAAAALSVTKLGAQPSSPYEYEIEAFLGKQEIR